MPVKPDVQTMVGNSVEVVNAIRKDASSTYQAMVPCAYASTESIRDIGKIITQYQPLKNEFIGALINRIARVIVTSKLYENPWAMFKKGLLEYGETVEEIFVNIAKPHTFDPEVAVNNVFKREIPDVRSVFHTMNYQKFYKSTISNDQLRQAFLSWNGITDLIAKIVDAMYTGANYDEFITMKYMIGRAALNGVFYPSAIPAVSAENSKGIVSTIKGVSNTLEFLKTEYNYAGVATATRKENQYIILNAAFDAVIDVEVLASAFNMDKAEFMGRRVLVDSFGAQDNARLLELFGSDPTFVPFTEDELTQLNSIPAILVDRDWFMIFDNFQNFTENYNGEGLYWNYWYHTWKTFSFSPFANAILFSTETPTVTGVAVSPTAVTVPLGGTAVFTAEVTTTGFASSAVTWKTSSPNTLITPDGYLTVTRNETEATVTVTATSVFDPTQTATATVTIG